MVSSPIYGIEGFLDQIYAVLTEYGYEVWMSHKGTFPVSPRGTAFDNCLEAVENCDAFLGIITGRYGSGIAPGEPSITHQEVLRAIKLDKLRWFLVHHHVAISRQLLKQFRFKKNGTPKRLNFKPTPILSDIRVLEMYEAAIREGIALPARTANWVQQYVTEPDALLYIESQFRDPERIRKLL
ncbi:MAG: hypothetical protein QOH25_1897 [Acidobacteriota bacterium]|jgi:hypothetical protein|nr:hypothetical protein [Acidobacteriota bacterium]